MTTEITEREDKLLAKLAKCERSMAVYRSSLVLVIDALRIVIVPLGDSPLKQKVERIAQLLVEVQDQDGPIQELDRVELLLPLAKSPSSEIARGTRGTVVLMYPGNKAYEVEFPGGVVATVPAEYLMRLGESQLRDMLGIAGEGSSGNG